MSGGEPRPVPVRALLARWLRVASGRSYWHTAQRAGIRFVPGRLEGYFKDYRDKTAWRGRVDDQGIPLLETHDGTAVYFPTTVFQKALGHWDRWLEADRAGDELERCARLVAWGLSHQDARGGWRLWPGRHPYASDYSALTQAQGISLMVRAAGALGEPACLEAAGRALELLLTPVEAGGVCREVSAGVVLEEYPADPPRTVLNGWVYALFGLHDYGLAVPEDTRAPAALEATLDALVEALPRFDAGYWSYYDLGGALASPGYHDLHIVQLAALEQTFPKRAGALSVVRERFERQRGSWPRRIRAVGVKVIQKLRRRPWVVFR